MLLTVTIKINDPPPLPKTNTNHTIRTVPNPFRKIKKTSKIDTSKHVYIQDTRPPTLLAWYSH